MVGIILLGQSNSGKSTLGKVVANKLGIRYISSGDIARRMAEMDGNIWNHLNAGGMAPEDMMRGMVLDTINSCDMPYILDGFPRFYDQYVWLNEHVDYDLIYVNVDVPYEDILTRAMSRSRSDDNSISKKMDFFEKETEPMIHEIFSNGETVYVINNGNDRSIQEGINALSKIVEDHLCWR